MNFLTAVAVAVAGGGALTPGEFLMRVALGVATRLARSRALTRLRS